MSTKTQLLLPGDLATTGQRMRVLWSSPEFLKEVGTLAPNTAVLIAAVRARDIGELQSAFASSVRSALWYMLVGPTGVHGWTPYEPER